MNKPQRKIELTKTASLLRVGIKTGDEKLIVEAYHALLNILAAHGSYLIENVPPRFPVATFEVMRDAKRLNDLRELCGFVEDGSSDVLTIFQDDATRDWSLRLGKTYLVHSGINFKQTIDEAVKVLGTKDSAPIASGDDRTTGGWIGQP